MAFNPPTQILIAFILILIFGSVLGELRMQRVAFSAYVGLVISIFLSDSISKFLIDTKLLNLDNSAVKIILFIATILLLSFHKKGDFAIKSKISIKSAILSFLTAGFILSNILSMLNPTTLNKLLTDYQVIAMIYDFKLWFIALTVVWTVVISFWSRKKDKDSN